jgi:hypothetical protein
VRLNDPPQWEEAGRANTTRGPHRSHGSHAADTPSSHGAWFSW